MYCNVIVAISNEFDLFLHMQTTLLEDFEQTTLETFTCNLHIYKVWLQRSVLTPLH